MTRDELHKMWESIKTIELMTNSMCKKTPVRKARQNIILKEIQKVKEQIQKEIGQME